MKIAIRIDDITTDMDWEAFTRFKEILDQLHICPLIGVVPDNQDQNLVRGKAKADYWEYIQSLQTEGWSIALHGHTHVYQTKSRGLFPLNRFSEFAGVPYEKQREKIRSGMSIFEQHHISTKIFMAPGHSYDSVTLRVLREMGFEYMTDGYGNRPYRYKGMTFLPISFHFQRAFRDREGYTCLVFHLNGMKKEQLDHVEQLLASHQEQLISYSEYIALDPHSRGVIGAVWEYILAYTKSVLLATKSMLLATKSRLQTRA